MRVLVDTHAFVWWLEGNPRLSRRARSVLEREGNEIFVSAATAWEIATKARLGRLPFAPDVAADVFGAIIGQGFQPLDITTVHAQRAGWLPGHHADPWDRMLIAQAQAEGLAVVSNETRFDEYGITRVW
ncbi:MAG TPA: type II toxin-antitoxin system VapC family toxin [Gemmatimonadales bacterium]|nr:type II toxin-antitoxin system VapC family toxin [Gemmatimonadales bacterium]